MLRTIGMKANIIRCNLDTILWYMTLLERVSITLVACSPVLMITGLFMLLGHQSIYLSRETIGYQWTHWHSYDDAEPGWRCKISFLFIMVFLCQDYYHHLMMAYLAIKTVSSFPVYHVLYTCNMGRLWFHKSLMTSGIISYGSLCVWAQPMWADVAM